MNQHTFLRKFGPWALVTGASDGIGHAFAEELSAIGFNLVVVARREDRLRQFADKITGQHATEVRVLAMDLSHPDAETELERMTAELDIGLLVAAAGYGTSGAFLVANFERERNMLELNCCTVLRQCLAFGARFASRGRGGIILMSSLLGRQGVPGAAHYAATKAYVQTLAEALASEFKSKGVAVLASAPGPVNSGFALRADMRMGVAVTPTTVAKASMSALGRRTTVVPGALSKLLTYSLAFLPRPARTQILAQVMRGMTKHQSGSAG